MGAVSFFYQGKNYTLDQVNTFFDIAQALTKGHHQFLLAKVNNLLTDLQAPIQEQNFSLEFYTFDSPAGQEVFWHTGAHILAQAVTRIYPHALYTIGPAIDKGFYYDFDLQGQVFLPEDVEKIEEEAQKIIEEKLPVSRKELNAKEALEVFKNNPYKQQIIKDLPDDEIISLYSQGDFIDLCKGPHLMHTGLVKAFKVMSFAGAYWKGDSNNPQLQRVYAIAYPDKKQLNSYLRFLEEAKKRDHRKIGKELDLFSFHEEGPGFPFWHAKGSIIFETLIDYMQTENKKRGYQEIKTPPILNDMLWKKSGHWNNYQKNMYFTQIDDRSFAVKPMNCPGGLLIFNTKLHSYRELPIKQAEFGLVHRHELSGVLHGLFRVRSFTQDDAHIFCTQEQLEQEILEIMQYILEVYKVFGFQDLSFFIATRPKENYIGTIQQWEYSTLALEKVLNTLELPYQIKEGEGAFYGPKIEVNVKDCLDRNWQLGTVQVDYSMPERFDIAYDGSDGKKHRPIMVHRAILGSLERFIGILIEHYEGKLPLWIAPVQVKILSISDAHISYCQAFEKKLRDLGFRVETDYRAETLGYKIKEARNQRMPYIAVAGDQECEKNTFSVRNRKNKSEVLSQEDFLTLLKEKNLSKDTE